MKDNRRSSYEIVLDILNRLQEKGKSNKCRLMQGAQIDSKTFDKYFYPLLESGLVSESNSQFEITVKGKDALDKLLEVHNILNVEC